MKFTQTDWTEANGTHLQGNIYACYHELVAVFGEPESGGDKTTVEWALKFEDGTVATIYDWKEYRVLEMNEKIEWHIGSFNSSISSDAKDEILNLL